GQGTFRALQEANPYVGEIGEMHTEPEIRIETILPVYKKTAVLRALLVSHPYEEPVYDFYLLSNDWKFAGAGVVGELPFPEDENSFLYRLKQIFQLDVLKHSPLRNKEIREVAVCGGSGAFLIPEAISYGADIFITGEARYNDYYDVEKRILLAVIGHYESEICTKELFFDIITKKIPNFALHFSTVNSNPVKYI
ncbi:MAG: Nif3-like dinuclear metal center hexameric protein, partial [Dysgonamonadaceae bacterium]|nr:Nif3-like dinuclear metal center hexameric protein [Dysgonamonadaceae bacterium]